MANEFFDFAPNDNWQGLGTACRYWVTDGPPLTNTTTQTTISPGPDFVVGIDGPPAYKGLILRCSAYGDFISSASSPTLSLLVKTGGNSFAIGTTSALGNVTTPQAWMLKFTMQCTSVASLQTTWSINKGLAFGVGAASQFTTGGRAAALGSSSNQPTLFLQAKWSAASTQNSVTCHFWSIEYLN